MAIIERKVNFEILIKFLLCFTRYRPEKALVVIVNLHFDEELFDSWGRLDHLVCHVLLFRYRNSILHGLLEGTSHFGLHLRPSCSWIVLSTGDKVKSF